MTKIQVGDVVTGYHKGYFRVVEVERRFISQDDLRYSVYQNKQLGDEKSPLIHYVKIAYEDFKPCKSKAIKTCDAAYCTVINQDYLDTTLRQKEDDLRNFKVNVMFLINNKP